VRVGISTACFYPYVNTEDTIKIIKRLGFNICEVFLEADCEVKESFIKDLKDRADYEGIRIYSVHAFNGVFEPFLFDRYERRRKEMVEKFERICRAGSMLGCECYVFHGLRKNTNQIGIKDIAKGMDSLVRISDSYGIKLAWENVSWCMTSSPEFIRDVNELMNEKIYFNLDIKQAVRSGEDPVKFLDVYKDRIINVHINDSDPLNSCLLPGKGCMDLKDIVERVSKINEEIPYIIEVYRENFDGDEDIITARKYLENIK